MKFTASLWEEIRDIYPKIIDHPFIQELMKGTLDQDRFIFYVQQDSLYLKDYSKALALIAVKFDTSERISQFLKFAEYSIKVEEERHMSYLKQQSITPGDQKSPACFTYTNFLLSVAALGSIEEAIASILPCFWVYEKVGNYICANAPENNPYHDWINVYAGDEFKEATDKVLEITDEIAGQANGYSRENMKEMFILSTKMEYLFWDSAYRKERWIV